MVSYQIRMENKSTRTTCLLCTTGVLLHKFHEYLLNTTYEYLLTLGFHGRLSNQDGEYRIGVQEQLACYTVSLGCYFINFMTIYQIQLMNIY